MPGLALASIVTSNPERADSAQRAHPGVAVLPDADTLFARADSHDLVVVAAPNRQHVPLGLAAVDAGLHLVVDKPLAASVADAQRLADAAAERGVVASVFHNRRWDGDFLTVRRLRDEGRLGDVVRFESRFERWRPESRDDAWREITTAEEGGGVLLDLGSHLIDQAMQLFGPVARVHGEVDARRGGVADDDAFVALEHRSGVHSHLWASSVAAAPGPRLRVLGTRGAFVIEGLDSQEDALREGRRPDAGWGNETRESWGRLQRGDKSEPVPSERGDWPAFYRGVERALREGGAPPVDPRDAIATLELIEVARDAGARGAGVPGG